MPAASRSRRLQVSEKKPRVIAINLRNDKFDVGNIEGRISTTESWRGIAHIARSAIWHRPGSKQANSRQQTCRSPNAAMFLAGTCCAAWMYQSRKSRPAPCDKRTVVSGTLSTIWARIAPDMRIKDGGRPADKRFPRATTSPHTKAETGASNKPTEATPSVAKSEALKFPPKG